MGPTAVRHKSMDALDDWGAIPIVAAARESRENRLFTSVNAFIGLEPGSQRTGPVEVVEKGNTESSMDAIRSDTTTVQHREVNNGEST